MSREGKPPTESLDNDLANEAPHDVPYAEAVAESREADAVQSHHGIRSSKNVRADRTDSADNYVSPVLVLENHAANGGAIAAIVLGIWSLIGAFITNWSIINGILGLLLGFWGLGSCRRQLAWVGIVLCLISIFLSMIQVNAWFTDYMKSVNETGI